jgi:hypothetical protein
MTQKIEISSPGSAFSEAVLLLREYSPRLNSELAFALSVISRAVAHSATNEAKCVLVAVKCQLFGHAQLHHALEMPKHSDRLDAVVGFGQLATRQTSTLNNALGWQTFGIMRKDALADRYPCQLERLI